MRQKLPVPRGWNRHVQKSVLQILSFCWPTIRPARGWAVPEAIGLQPRARHSPALPQDA